MKSMKFLFLIIGVLLVSVWAEAQERITLNFHDQIIQTGRSDGTLYLKREIMKQYPRLRLNNMDLVRVRLVAKTRNGMGTARLVVGDWFSSDKRVYGTPREFQSRQPRTFDRVNFENNSWNSQGVWQIKLRGNFMVRKVVVVFRPDRWRNPPPREKKQHVACESHQKEKAICRVPFVIDEAHLVSLMSHRLCIKNYSWGFYGNVLWVDRGCRGVFEVISHDNGPRQPPRRPPRQPRPPRRH